MIGIAYRQLYFLQLENYDLGRFLRLVPRSYSFSHLRQKLVWTPKLVALHALALLIEAASATVATLPLPLPFLAAAVAAAGVFVLLCLVAHFVSLSVAVLLFSPFDAVAKRRIIAAAGAALSERTDLTIVAIAGSYGKTTMKDALAAALSGRFRVLATPGNLNTPLGISRTILGSLAPDTEVLIVEMGEHRTGDLAFLTKLVPPDITVVTGIGEAHLERFGAFDKLIAGIFESVAGTASGKLVVMNADSRPVVENYARYLDGHAVAFYSSANAAPCAYTVGGVSFPGDASGVSFSLRKGAEDLGTFFLPLLGGYAPGVAVAACIVGERLGMAAEEVKRGLATMRPVPHRLEVVPSQNGVLVIDDSYNGNPEGVRYAIEALARFAGRRRIYVTPGLVEAGGRSADVHRAIGRELAKAADIVVLIRNSVTPFIAEGLEREGFPREGIHWFRDALEAHAAIPALVKAGDVVLFQNDWPDNYA